MSEIKRPFTGLFVQLFMSLMFISGKCPGRKKMGLLLWSPKGKNLMYFIALECLKHWGLEIDFRLVGLLLVFACFRS